MSERDEVEVPTGAEVRGVAPCALCGTPTLRAPLPAPMHMPALHGCSEGHERILREALDGASLSTVVVGREDGATLALRAFARGAGVVVVTCATGGAEPTDVKRAVLTPREARRLATALVRAANRATGRQPPPMAQA